MKLAFPIIKLPPGTKIGVVGDIHEHKEQFQRIIDRFKPSEKNILVSVGDIYDKGFGQEIGNEIVDILRPLVTVGQAFVLRGNHELKVIRKARAENKMTSQLEWMEQQPLAVSFQFEGGSYLTAMHGGITPAHTWESIFSDIQICYVRSLDEQGKMIKKVWRNQDGRRLLVPEKEGGTTWHKSYDGRFGYIAAGHDAQKDGIPKFYNYSCNLDTAVYQTGVLTMQVFSSHGKEDLVMVAGEAKQSII